MQLSVTEAINKLDAGDVADARKILVHLRSGMLTSAAHYGVTESPSETISVNGCPECGPHGNKGRVLLLESWVDCLTCKGGA